MLVIVEDGGGLANRLFVFANIIAAGLATGHRVANPAFRGWAASFEGTAGDGLSFYPRRLRPRFGGALPSRFAASLSYRGCALVAKTSGFGPTRAIALEWPQSCDLDDPVITADLKKRRLVLLKGWLFRHRTGVELHADLIRDFFRPVVSIREEADRLVDAARRQADVLVGVHIRRRDYRSFMDGRYFYDLGSYLASMKSVAAIFSPRRVAFLVCSDEMLDLSSVEGVSLTTSAMGPVQDLWALSRCDLVMGPPSTFSTWAAFLGKVPRWEIVVSDAEPAENDFVVPSPVPRTPQEMGRGNGSMGRENNPHQCPQRSATCADSGPGYDTAHDARRRLEPVTRFRHCHALLEL
ncbi:MAG: alpha-1,2-fucosyltransferase [Acidobacteriota bacterium]